MAFFPTREVNRLIGTGISTDFPLVLFQLLDDMVALGWRVFGSGDGLSLFSNQGQTAGGEDPGNPWGTWSVIRSGGAGANGLSNQAFNVGSAWVRLRTPADAAVQREYLWILDFRSGISLADWRLLTTRDASGFDTGADADTAPVAAGHVALAGNQVAQAAATDFRTWIPSGTGNLVHWILGDKDDEYAFIWFSVRSTDLGVWGVWGLDQISPAFPGSAPPGTEDPDPFYHLISHAASSFMSYDWADGATIGRSDIGSLSSIRVEDYTGTQGPERGLIASAFLGEPGPPPEAGHYPVAIGPPAEGDLTSWLGQIGISPGLGRGYVTNAIPVLKAATVPRFFKGFSRGRLIRASSFGSAIPNTVSDASQPTDQQTRARFGDIGFSIPWPAGVGVAT